MITINCTIDTKQVLDNLNRIKEKSSSSLSDITKEMAQETMVVAQNELSPHNNGGDLSDSLRIINESFLNMSISTLFTDSPYAKYFYYGTSGSWWTSLATLSQTSSSEKYDKYSGKPWYNIRESTDGNRYYHFVGQKAHPFLEIALATTKSSIISLAKSKYIEKITEGIR